MSALKRKSNARKSSLNYHKVSHLYDTRDNSGVPDMVLLEEYKSEDAFVNNLKIRYSSDIIYTYIGSVLVAINPYKNIPIYSPEFINKYRGFDLFEMPPHIFAIADVTYRTMLGSQNNQSILISGESGAGKTESMKKIILYIAAASHHSPEVERVREKLQKSVPILEALGNAKTNRNDNSSRFGKYMDIQFNFLGSIIGAKITSYLLEKSRVVNQSKGERNFHIFYQIFKMKEVVEALHLTPEPSSYKYIMHKENVTVDSIDDLKEFKYVRDGLRICGIMEDEEGDILNIIGCVLHIGQLNYEEKGGKVYLTNADTLKLASEMIGCSTDDLGESLMHRKIKSGKDTAVANLSKSEIHYARDALSKTLYERCFIWLVERINISLVSQCKDDYKNRMGLLDIFGFEIFQLNSFEQLCINYCNEKLHQLFIEKTLKQEQEDYLREGIDWETVEYDDNSPICRLIDANTEGIFSLLDEECLMPGNRTDATLHAKLQDRLKSNKWFCTRTAGGLDKEFRKGLKLEEFKIKHYAGEVVYSTTGFIDKNKDLLYNDIKKVLCSSQKTIIQQMFSKDDLDDKKRPVSVCNQFKTSLSKLVALLELDDLHYVRCIKPNMNKEQDNFDETTIRHQVRYMGLVENVRVCRAGFAFKRPYEIFIKRYYCICPKTWPKYYKYSPKEAVTTVLQFYNFQLNTDFKQGVTKIFIKSAETISHMEALYQNKKIELVCMMQAIWRYYNDNKKFNQLTNSANLICKWTRSFISRELLKKRIYSVRLLQKFFRGSLDYKNGNTQTPYYKEMRQVKVYTFVSNLIGWYQGAGSINSWPKASPVLSEVSTTLKGIYENIFKSQKKVANPMEFIAKFDEEKVLVDEINTEKVNDKVEFQEESTRFEEDVHRKYLKTKRQLNSQFTHFQLKLTNKDMRHKRRLLDELFNSRTKELQSLVDETHAQLQIKHFELWNLEKVKAKAKFESGIKACELLEEEKRKANDSIRCREMYILKNKLENVWCERFMAAFHHWNSTVTNANDTETRVEWNNLKNNLISEFQVSLARLIRSFVKEEKEQEILFQAQYDKYKQNILIEFDRIKWTTATKVQQDASHCGKKLEIEHADSIKNYFANTIPTNFKTGSGDLPLSSSGAKNVNSGDKDEFGQIFCLNNLFHDDSSQDVTKDSAHNQSKNQRNHHEKKRQGHKKNRYRQMIDSIGYKPAGGTTSKGSELAALSMESQSRDDKYALLKSLCSKYLEGGLNEIETTMIADLTKTILQSSPVDKDTSIHLANVPKKQCEKVVKNKKKLVKSETLGRNLFLSTSGSMLDMTTPNSSFADVGEKNSRVYVPLSKSQIFSTPGSHQRIDIKPIINRNY